MVASALKTMPRRNIAMGSEMSLENITTQGKKLPNRVVVHATEGWGKTSFGAEAPSPIFLMIGGETGLWTLMESGQVDEKIPHFPKPAETWLEVQVALNELIVKDHPYKTFVVDTLNGMESLCHQHVCQTQFGGDFGEKGFMAFHRGYVIAAEEWIKLFPLMDRLREKGMGILLLCHTSVTTFKNPEGPDYDRYTPAVHPKTWAPTHKWADMVLFGNFETHVDTNRSNDKKGKGRDGQTRMLYTERSAAFDAKNRHGLPPEIECGSSPKEAWDAFVNAVKTKKGPM